MPVIQIRSDSRYPFNRVRVKSLVARILEQEGLVSPLIVSIFVVGGRQMKRINKSFHEEDIITDVLSFPYLDPVSNPHQIVFKLPPEEIQILGDLIICYPQAVSQAREKGLLVDDEIDALVEHGMQHLLGHHHE